MKVIILLVLAAFAVAQAFPVEQSVGNEEIASQVNFEANFDGVQNDVTDELVRSKRHGGYGGGGYGGKQSAQ